MRALKIVTDDHLELDEIERELPNDPLWPELYAALVAQLPCRALCLLDDFDGEKHDPKATAAITKLRAWFDEDDRSGGIAVLSGTAGTGKTIAACWIALRRLAFHEPRFISAHKLARLPRTGDERDEIFGANVVIIDDLGAEHPTSNAAWLADVDELFDAIYASESWAVITTNLTWKQFVQRYGPRVADRLAECGAWITVTGKSMRGAKP